MRLRLLRLRLHRRLRKGQKQVEGLGQQTEQGLERYFFKRFARLAPVRRFVAGWTILIILLIGGVITQTLMLGGYYQKLEAIPGGIYNEGIVGTFTNANPLYATNDVDTSLSRLIFASLFSYDSRNQLTGDLAQNYSVDAKSTTYTVHLKPHLTWQDGQPLTSADVLFTYKTIQNPDAQSPLNSSWQDITVTAPDPLTIVFQLPNPLASFPYSLTNGIVPQHLLASIPAVDLRSADFNTSAPVGAGPFSWKALQIVGGDPTTAEEQIALTPFAGYQAGKPQLQEFVEHAYASADQLTQAFNKGELNGVEGLPAVPARLPSGAEIHSLLLSAENMVFFKTSVQNGILNDTKVRQALTRATNQQAIINKLGYATHPVNEPLLIGQLGYNSQYAQAGFDLNGAKQLLNQDGWAPNQKGIMTKGTTTLGFTLTAADTPEDHTVTDQLKRQWGRLGVDLRVTLDNSADFQNAVTYHSYEAILYGISIGPDPDVFVYWDSTQADVRSANRLNLSEYKNGAADVALEGGRTRLSPDLRTIKYKPFLAAWQQDAPAVGLYQPRLLYLTNGPVAGLQDHQINTATDRFNNVQNWEIREAKVNDQ